MQYYTYAYLREDRTPYYIGKGKGNRAHIRRFKGINPPKDKSRILILKQNLTEEEAFKHEIYMIAVFGRKDLGTGILHNRTNGGEGTSGRITSEQTRRKRSISLKGRPRSEETKRKISETLKGKNHLRVKKVKTKKLIYKKTKEQIEQLKIIQVKAVEEAKKPESIRKRKQTLSKIRHQQGETNSQYGKMWITDGTKNGSYKISKDDIIPEGYRKGRVCI